MPRFKQGKLNDTPVVRWACISDRFSFGRLHARNNVEECVKHGTPAIVEDLDIIVDQDQEGTTVRLHGRLGIDSSPTLRDQLVAMLRVQPPKAITVDLTEVGYIDASGVATLLEALKTARNRRMRFCLKGLQGRMARLFEVTGLLPVFEAACKGVSPELR